ncbi:MAG: UDP-N-acetylmuramate dehydrogenase [Pseudomonadota bacterium]
MSKLPKVRGSYRENFQLSNVTWFNVGGPADILFKPADIDDLSFFLKKNKSRIPYFVLGVGSNLLVRDAGIRDIVIRLGKGFTDITHENNILIAGAGALDLNVSKYCAENSLAGLEFLSGIPGVIGAALAMNAGAYGREISDCLIKLEALDENGNLLTINKEDCRFTYRGNGLSDKLIFTKAFLEVSLGKKEEIEKQINHIQLQRSEAQPIRSKTSGSSFKNPPGKKAWELIDHAGCRGLRIGDAMISEKHCNFLINVGNATASDIEELGELVREKVYKKTGVNLEWEIKIIGQKA